MAGGLSTFPFLPENCRDQPQKWTTAFLSPAPTMFISVKNSDTAPRHWEANGFFSDEEMFSSSHNNGAFTETYLVTWILLTAVSLHTWEFCQQILVMPLFKHVETLAQSSKAISTKQIRRSLVRNVISYDKGSIPRYFGMNVPSFCLIWPDCCMNVTEVVSRLHLIHQHSTAAAGAGKDSMSLISF